MLCDSHAASAILIFLLSRTAQVTVVAKLYQENAIVKQVFMKMIAASAAALMIAGLFVNRVTLSKSVFILHRVVVTLDHASRLSLAATVSAIILMASANVGRVMKETVVIQLRTVCTERVGACSSQFACWAPCL